MHRRIESVAVLGGGDAGLLAALCIRRLNPELAVSVIDDFSEGTPQVGKSTYKKITELLHSFLDLNEQSFIEEVKPIWKGSVHFTDWCGYRPFHFPFDTPTKFPQLHDDRSVEHYALFYHELADSPEHLTTGEAIVEQRTSPMFYDPASGQYDRYQHVAYHLDVHRFNGYLRDRCRERNIDLVDDRIEAVDVDGDLVTALQGEADTYSADLYIDASGFARRIRNKLPGDYREFPIPLDAALVTQLPLDLRDVEPATVVESGEFGWFWQIDTFDHRDVGYVFASDYVEESDARREFVEHLDGAVEPDTFTRYNFDSGYYPNPWVGNCVSIGNAEGFVEPLQSTGLTVNGWAAQILSRIIAASGGWYDEVVAGTYNEWVSRLWESVFDFVHVHYLCGRGESAFWQDVTTMEPSPRIGRLFELFDHRGFAHDINPLENDPDVLNTLVFSPPHFYLIMRNMRVESAFYEACDIEISDEVRQAQQRQYGDMQRDVEGYLTVEELYRGVLELA